MQSSKSEHELDKLGVTGSSPVPPIEKALQIGRSVVARMGDDRLFVARICLAIVVGDAEAPLPDTRLRQAAALILLALRDVEPSRAVWGSVVGVVAVTASLPPRAEP
jgi:hypothetical protein